MTNEPTISVSERDSIQPVIEEFDDRHDVYTVFAANDGSFAFGTAHDESDYDVAVVYTEAGWRQLAGKDRANLRDAFTPAQVAELTNGQLSREVEIDAIRLDQFASQLRSDNLSAVETLLSVRPYIERVAVDDLRSAVRTGCNEVSLYHHYRSMSENTFRKKLSDHFVRHGETFPVLEENDGYVIIETDAGEERLERPVDASYTRTKTEQTVKRNLTVARASLMAETTLERKEVPPLNVTRLLDVANEHEVAPELCRVTERLIEQKRVGDADNEVGVAVRREMLPDPEVTPDGSPETGEIPVDEFIVDALLATPDDAFRAPEAVLGSDD